MKRELQFKQVKTQFDIQQFIAKYCSERNIKVDFVHDDVIIEEQYSKDLQKAIEEFLKD